MHRILKNNVRVKATVCFDFEFDEGHGKRTTKHVDVSEGDRIVVQFFEPRFGGQTLSTKARVSRIIHVPKRCNEEDISLQIDASVEYKSKTYVIPTKNILDIELIAEGEHEPNIPVIPPVDAEVIPTAPQAITWTLEPVSIITEGGANPYSLLKIPYARNMAGIIYFSVTDTAGNVFFKEKFVAENTNIDASFTWSLRSFAGVAEKLQEAGVENVLTDKNGFFIYQNGDNVDPIISATDNDNSLIIPAGTVLVFTIMHTLTEDIGESVTSITKEYVVTKADVDSVTKL